MRYAVDLSKNGFFFTMEDGMLKSAAMFPEDLDEPAESIYFEDPISLMGLVKFAKYMFPSGRAFAGDKTIILRPDTIKTAAPFSIVKFEDVFSSNDSLYKSDEKYYTSSFFPKFAGEREDSELELWKKYKYEGDTVAKSQLLKSLKPMIISRVLPWMKNSPLPESAVEAEGIRLAAEAFETYDPKKGAQLKTHVWNRLNKIHRYGYTYQNVGSIPEPRAAQVGTYQNTVEMLRDKLEREPSIDEIRQELGWKISDIQSMQKELRGDLILDSTLGPVQASDTDIGKEALHMVYFDAKPETKEIMEYTFDEFENKPTLSTADEVARKLKIPVNEVRKEYKWIANEIEKVFSAAPVHAFATDIPDLVKVNPW